MYGVETAVERRPINMLVFGGSRFCAKEPNEEEYSNACFLLTITPGEDNYALKYLPGATLRCPDKFFGNMQTHCDLNHNTITVIGKKAAHRINTGRKDFAHLRWKLTNEQLGYGKAIDEVNWNEIVSQQRMLQPFAGNNRLRRR